MIDRKNEVTSEEITIELTQEEKATNAETWEHINIVMRRLASAQRELQRRMFTHDRSKLVPPEVSVFAEYTSKLKGSTYGSDEYKENLKGMGDGITHHYENNRHHPEYPEFQNPSRHKRRVEGIENHLTLLDYCQRNNLAQQPDDVYIYQNIADHLKDEKAQLESPINGMNLFDLLEMLIDWTAAVQRHDDGDINESLRINQKRFNISPQLQAILENTVPWIKDDFEGLGDTQQGLSPND